MDNCGTRLARSLTIGAPGFEPGIARSQSEYVSRYTTPRCDNISTENLEYILDHFDFEQFANWVKVN